MGLSIWGKSPKCRYAVLCDAQYCLADAAIRVRACCAMPSTDGVDGSRQVTVQYEDGSVSHESTRVLIPMPVLIRGCGRTYASTDGSVSWSECEYWLVAHSSTNTWVYLYQVCGYGGASRP
eukprot:1076059-Rhodomonas_salina.3